MTLASRFKEPANLEDAYRLRDELRTAVADIEAALANKNRHDRATGARMGAVEYHTWRSKAVIALKGRCFELQGVNAYIRKHATPAQRLDVRMFAALVADGVAGHEALTEEEAIGAVCRLADGLALDWAEVVGGRAALRETTRQLACAVFVLARASGLVPRSGV